MSDSSLKTCKTFIVIVSLLLIFPEKDAFADIYIIYMYLYKIIAVNSVHHLFDYISLLHSFYCTFLPYGHHFTDKLLNIMLKL